MLRKAAQKLRNANFVEVILCLLVLTGIISLSFADIMSTTAIHNTGKIVLEIMAQSGYWQHIQAAVNLAASLGVGIVHIPEGTWNFVNVGESWGGARVTIPAGVNVSGAPTERDANGQVVEWKTVLVMPWDMPGSKGYVPPHWFLIQGDNNPTKPSRFSDIKLVGYRDFDPSATGHYLGIRIEGVTNFRIDHCCTKEIPEGIYVGVGYGAQPACGVIDHNLLDNEYVSYTVNWDNRNIGYGVCIYRSETATEWPNIADVLGKYLDYTVFIEDNVFTKWRSVVVGNYGAHYVFRHNVVIHGLGAGEIDLHPSYTSPYASCRAAELYENLFTDPDPKGQIYYPFMSEHYGGSGVYFNNTVSGYDTFIEGQALGWNPAQHTHDVYVWGNEIGSADLWSGYGDEGSEYFLYEPEWYTPYQYPHPLTLK